MALDAVTCWWGGCESRPVARNAAHNAARNAARNAASNAARKSQQSPQKFMCISFHFISFHLVSSRLISSRLFYHWTYVSVLYTLFDLSSNLYFLYVVQSMSYEIALDHHLFCGHCRLMNLVSNDSCSSGSNVFS